jgi:perosamine synthetase
MKQKYIPYGHQWIEKDDIQAVTQVLKSDWLAQGPKVVEFERALAKETGAKYAVAVSSGTAALHIAYLAAHLHPGDEVITTAMTFAGTSNMILAAGAIPVFCDIRPDTYNIDEKQIEKLITKKTKAIAPVHFAGQPCEMRTIHVIAKKHNLLVIEDAAHALGSSYRKKPIGSLSDMTILSFHPVKAITTGEGGAVLTNNKLFYERLLDFRSHGIHKEKLGKNVMTELGFNYRLSDMQAALGVSQLKKLRRFVQKRKAVVKWYEELLDDYDPVVLPQHIVHTESAWHLYAIRVKNVKIRDGLAAFMQKNGIGVNFHYPAVYSHPYYRTHGYADVHLVNADLYEKTCLVLPCFPQMKKDDAAHVVKLLKRYLNAKV